MMSGCSSTSTSTSTSSVRFKLYQTFIFFLPICFTLILLLIFYLFYLRRRSVDVLSLRLRAAALPYDHTHDFYTPELGLKKELREMLPIIVYKESFCVNDTQCSVCLVDYEAEDKLQQIPSCGHSFHMDCIDHWLANHTTCPLCRLSITPPTISSDGEAHTIRLETGRIVSNMAPADEIVLPIGHQTLEEIASPVTKGEETGSQCDIGKGRNSVDV